MIYSRFSKIYENFFGLKDDYKHIIEISEKFLWLFENFEKIFFIFETEENKLAVNMNKKELNILGGLINRVLHNINSLYLSSKDDINIDRKENTVIVQEKHEDNKISIINDYYPQLQKF